MTQGQRPAEEKSNLESVALIRKFYASPMSGEDIEAESLKIIDREAPPHNFSTDQWKIAQRMIHTTADFALLESLRFSPDAITAASQALRDARPIYVDSNMIRSGISVARLRSVCADYGPGSIHCHIADDDVATEARQTGLPRSLYAVRKAKPILNGSIALFGNAPIALLELNRLILEDGIKPSLVVAMPVGFVHVVESKQELMTLGVPYIALEGRRGGSPIAVSTVHALCTIALNHQPK